MNGYAPGLAGVVAAQTRLSSVDGEAGELLIAGYPVEVLASQATFEEVAYLLWHGALPNRRQLRSFGEELAARREVPPVAYEVLRSAAADQTPAMDTLRMAAGTLNAAGDTLAVGQRILAQMPTLIAAGWRLSQGQDPIAPRADLGHAANYLYMLFGDEPVPERVRGLETYLNTVVDHGLNASTFTARSHHLHGLRPGIGGGRRAGGAQRPAARRRARAGARTGF